MKHLKYLTILILNFSLAPLVVGEETIIEKGQNKIDEGITSIKKEGRKIKKKIRDVTGNSSVKEDLKDSANNLKDEAKDAAKKIERKFD